MTKLNLGRVAALTLAIVPALSLAGERMTLLPGSSTDQVPARLQSAKAAVAKPDVERAPVQFAWALDQNAIIAKQAPFVAESREYWRTVDADALRAGVPMFATAPGAVVRLSPVAGAAQKSLNAAQVQVRRHGKTLSADEALANTANAAELKAAGIDFPSNTIAFTLREDLGTGEFAIAMPEASGAFLMHVFEPNSTEVFALTTDRTSVLGGGELAVTASYASGMGKQLGDVAGTIAAPNGRLFDLEFAAQRDGSWKAVTTIDAQAGMGEGLWEVHTISTSADGQVRRDARTAFNAAPATAKFAGSAEVDAERDGALSMSFAVQVSAPSRYNVSAMLYGTDDTGTLLPMAIAQSAAWLESGARAIDVRFDAALIEASGLRAPFEVRGLTLTNQGNLGVMEERERALRINKR
jgi:hypothetical protein